MIRKLFLMTLSALLLLTGMPMSLAQGDLVVENVPPEEPIVTEGEHIRVTAEYDPDAGFTRYTAELTGSPTFSDGTPMTAQDLIFSLYVYLDPGYTGEIPMHDVDIVGLESYRRQVSEERLSAACTAMENIIEAGAEHAWSEDDGWTEEQQTFYWDLHAQYAAACEGEFTACAQAIVDYCCAMLETDARGAFGLTSAEISADEGLRTAYAMLQWGYATADGSALTAKRSGTVWNLDSVRPSAADFANELILAYNGDLAACWAIEATGTYEPALPELNVPEAFLAHLIGEERDGILSISGIRMVDETTLEIEVEGVDMRSAGALFCQPVLSTAADGDEAQWNPEAGLYGHPFGDVSGVRFSDGPGLLQHDSVIIF